MEKLIRLKRRKLFASLVFVISGMLAFTSYTMWRMHAEALDNGLEIAAMHASGFEDFVTQNLHFIELSAVTAAQAYAEKGSAPTSNSLAASVHNAPFMRSMSLLETDGRVIASSNPANIGLHIEMHDYLPATDDAREILRMGQPWRGRDFADGSPTGIEHPLSAEAPAFLPLVRSVRVDNATYRLVVAINPDYFVNYFLQQLDASIGSVTVLRYDGTVLMDSIDAESVGVRLAGLVHQLDLHDSIGARFDGTAGQFLPALNAFRSSSQYPVLVLTRLDREYALRHWRTEVRTLMIVVSLALVLVCLLAIGSFRRRLQIAVEREIFERQQSVHASVFTHAREAILITTPDGTIVDINSSFTRITGYNAEDVVGHKPSILSSGRHDRAFYEKMWNELLQRGHWHGEIWNRRKNGVVYPELLTIGAVRGSGGEISQYVALFSDITRAKEHEQELEHIAHYDALTNLPNRVLLADRLRQGIFQSQRRGTRLAVAFIDLDGFKQVNDVHGHDAGDALLVELSGRMKKALRGGDTLARLGGDEFVAVLLDLPDNGSSLPMLSRLLKAVSQPFEFGEAKLKVSGSLGVTFYPQTEDVDADTLLRQADQAMYQAKVAGKDRYHVFDAALDRDLRTQHESVERMRRALLDGEYVLHYQPKVNLGSGAIVGAEALIRWQHPERGLLLPAEFLPLVEDHPLAVDIGEWVLTTALRQAVEWRCSGLPLPISVNIGARQLQQGDFVSRLCDILGAEPNAEPGDIELEILETSALQDLARISQVIEACQRLGVPFALDDFGTGYSSLTYLKRLPVSVLKIDQSFVRGMLDDPDDLAILEGVVGLAKSFHRDVIAEGVETAEHSEMLLRLGCKLAQGYGIARPMPAESMPAWAETWRAEGAWLDLPTVGREDVPLLFASVEHRAWVKALERHLMDQSGETPQLDPRHCRFGRWLNTEGRQRYGDRVEMQAILQLHEELHDLAHRLVDLHLADEKDAARAGLADLRVVHNALLGYIRRLLHRPVEVDKMLQEEEMAAPGVEYPDAGIDGDVHASLDAGPDAAESEGARQFV